MRMRKKKYLNERLEAVGDILYICNSDDRNFNTAVKEKAYLNFEEWFGNNNPLYLEIGCGKGKFAVEYAKSHPEINLLAVEKDGNVVVAACEAAEYLPKFIPEKKVERLFLNFSCPFPKKTYASHRLTHHSFLDRYKPMLATGAEIHQKTDNMHFFEFSIEQFSQSGFKIKNLTLDLHNSGFEGNIITEYEQRFLDLGQPIYRLEAYLD